MTKSRCYSQNSAKNNVRSEIKYGFKSDIFNQNSNKIEMIKQEKLKKLDRSESMKASIGRKPNDPSGFTNKIGRRKSRNSMSNVNVSFNEDSLRDDLIKNKYC